MLDTVISQSQSLFQNQFLAGGFGLMLIGTLGYYARFIARRIYLWIRAITTVTLTIPYSEKAFDWVAMWISTNFSDCPSPVFTISGSRKQSNEPSNYLRNFDNEKEKDKMKLSLMPINYPIWKIFRGKLMVIEIIRTEKDHSNGLNYFTDTIQITVFPGNKDVATSILNEAKALFTKGKEDHTEIFTTGSYGDDWRAPLEISPRKISSVIVPDDILIPLKEDIEFFLSSKKLYADLGIPYRRGYLLTGAPGSGKSSFVAALANEFKIPLFILTLSKLSSDSVLSSLLNNVDPGSIVLIEDIDCSSFPKSREGSDESIGLTLSGFLNAIDGIGASEGRIIIMTTNHPETLDPALLRPGRVDMRFEFPPATVDTAKALYRRFFPSSTDEEVNSFVSRLDMPVSMADVQHHAFVQHRKLWRKSKSSETPTW